MFFSAKDLYLYLQDNAWDYEYETGQTLSFSSVRRYVKAAKEAIVRRDGHLGVEYRSECLYKWYRPWDVVPKLRDFQAPEGDYGIGVEVEMGFRSQRAAQTIANKIKGWKYVAVDIEGGTWPIEATFPPVLYSKLSNKSQVFRYLKLLRDNQSLVEEHGEYSSVGTHINVSKGGVTNYDTIRLTQLREQVNALSYEDQKRYFGRRPYGVANCYSGKYLEFKLFNSTTDSRALKRYINIAVALTDLITSRDTINQENVIAALELGYNK